jgi:DNA-binding PadR family transcriptional regulator
MHGYAIARYIFDRSREELQIDEGTLYPALHRQELKGLIRADWGLSENNRKARYYDLTAAGRRALLLRQTPMWRRYQRLWGSDSAADAHDEVEFHIEMRVADLVRRPKRASRPRASSVMCRASAPKEGAGSGTGSPREQCRFPRSLTQDIAYGARAIVRSRVFSVSAIATLALGIGLSTAMFTVLNAVLLRPLPFHAADSLVVVWNRFPFAGYERVSLAPLEYPDLATGTRNFQSLSALSYGPKEIGRRIGGRSAA